MIKRYVLPDEALLDTGIDVPAEELRQIWESLEVGPVHMSDTLRRAQQRKEQHPGLYEWMVKEPFPRDRLDELYRMIGNPQDVCESMERHGIFSSGVRVLFGEKYPYSEIVKLKQAMPDERLRAIESAIAPLLEKRVQYSLIGSRDSDEWLDRELSGEITGLVESNGFTEQEGRLVRGMVPPMSVGCRFGNWTDYCFGVYFLNNGESPSWFLVDGKKESGLDLLAELQPDMPFQRQRYVVWGVPPKHIRGLYARNPDSTQKQYVSHFVFALQARGLAPQLEGVSRPGMDYRELAEKADVSPVTAFYFQKERSA